MTEKILGLDISTKTGWALFDGPKLIDYGRFEFRVGDIDYSKFSGNSLENALKLAKHASNRIIRLVNEIKPNVVIIEQTNLGKSRYTQKVLEFIHYAILDELMKIQNIQIEYVSSSEWRKKVDLKMTKEDKKHNRMVKLEKIRGRLTKKHLAVRKANELFNLNFRIKDNDVCDAILIAYSRVI